MSLNAAVNASPQTSRFAGFLAGALVLHGLFLMLPAQRALQPGEVLHRLSVSLRSAAPAPAQPDVESAQLKPKRPVAAPSEDTFPAAESRPPPPPVPPSDPTEEAPAPGLSTARLLDFAHRKRWTLPEASEPRRLGAPRPGSLHRSREAGRPAADAPETAPGIEIMDRWLAADGARNILIRTPSGRLICGRTEAWDPMRPLVEQVRMLRDCGSGEPTFEWPEQYRADAPRRPWSPAQR
jgi:hypothetical protein